MSTCQTLHRNLAKYVNSMLSVHDKGHECILTVPWTDGLGEPLRIAVSQEDSFARVDDDGAIFFAMGRLGVSTKSQQQSLEQFVEDFLKMRGIKWDRDNQIAEMELDFNRLPVSLMYFAQTVGACIDVLPAIAKHAIAPSLQS